MRAVVVYESMFGCTRAVAEAVTRGLAASAEVSLLAVADANPGVLDGADLLVVGGPTHVHGMSRPSTRKAAREQAQRPGSHVVLEPDADVGLGIREWLASLDRPPRAGAVFDTRLKGPAVITGRASKSMRRALAHQGVKVVAHPKSFLVDQTEELLAGEVARAQAWGAQLTRSNRLQGAVERRRATTT